MCISGDGWILNWCLENPPPRLTFAAVQPKSFIKKNTVMSDHIENEGKKGRTMMWLLIYFILFIVLLIYLYKYNNRLEF